MQFSKKLAPFFRIMETPLINDSFVLKKGKEKGAWTFVEMPVLENVPRKRNSTVRVRGFIDDYELEPFNIWAMKKGTFLAVKADIRKRIRKEEGDSVKITLYLDDAPMVIPEDFLACLRDEPSLLQKFQDFEESRKKDIINWIFSPAVDDQIVLRMARIMEKLESSADFKLS